jgi:glycosyltransferase involved in cell wall biosynthesis
MSQSPNDDAPLVSVLFSTYNTAAYLPTVCRSIQAQTYPNFEVVIFDDGSTDDTRVVLAPFAKDPRFQIRGWKPNRGVNAAWREVLGMGRGKYWASPGADDVLLPGFLEQRVAVMEAHPEAAVVYGAVECIDENGVKIQNSPMHTDFPALLDAGRAVHGLLRQNFIVQPSTMVRSDMTRKVLPYYLPGWVGQDWQFWILLIALGGGLLWDARPLMQYRMHRKSLSGQARLEPLRRAEFRLVPLCALKAAAQYSPLAAQEWTRRRDTLYRLWLWRALKLRLQGALQKEWLALGNEAYYGDSRKSSLVKELCRHGPGVVAAMLQQIRTLKQPL